MLLLKSLTDVFFPSLCLTCKNKLFTGERYLCFNCMLDLPKTNFHNSPDNKVARLFWGRVMTEHATAWLFFRKGSQYQRMVHYLKYKGLKEIGEEFGYLFGTDIKDSGFGGSDVIVPVPLHKHKMEQRGYNQSEWIARGLGKALGKPVMTCSLERMRFTSTQTRKNRFERWQNVEGIFSVNEPEEILHRHILLVDDVVTTGSTLEAAVHTLLLAGASRVSIAALAYTE